MMFCATEHLICCGKHGIHEFFEVVDSCIKTPFHLQACIPLEICMCLLQNSTVGINNVSYCKCIFYSMFMYFSLVQSL